MLSVGGASDQPTKMLSEPKQVKLTHGSTFKSLDFGEIAEGWDNRSSSLDAGCLHLGQ